MRKIYPRSSNSLGLARTAIFLILILAVPGWLLAQTITTVAGNGTSGYGGDGGAATNAFLNRPYGGVFDANENLYIVDRDNHRIREVSTNGIITTVAGNGTAGFSGDGGEAISASMGYPYGLAVDAIGNIYIADQGNPVFAK